MDEENNGERDFEGINQRKNRGNFGVFQNNMRERERRRRRRRDWGFEIFVCNVKEWYLIQIKTSSLYEFRSTLHYILKHTNLKL